MEDLNHQVLELSQSMKRSLSLQFENTKKSRLNELDLTEFVKRISIWAGNSIEDNNNKVFLQDTCTVDY